MLENFGASMECEPGLGTRVVFAEIWAGTRAVLAEDADMKGESAPMLPFDGHCRSA
jgi:hypothetical protein